MKKRSQKAAKRAARNKTPTKTAKKMLPAGMPMLSIRGAAAAIEFYKQAFDAIETAKIAMPDGRVGHCELKIGGTTVSLADEWPEGEAMGWSRSPSALGGSSIILQVYFPDVDATWRQAVAAGAKSITPPQDQFYGARSARIADPFGHLWMLSTQLEDISIEEMLRRADSGAARPSAH